MKNLDEIPYLDDEWFRIPEARYAELVENMLQVMPGEPSDEEAMRLVDAVIGPLLLLPPPPATSLDSECRHRYFHFRDGWIFCTKDHEGPDDDPQDHGNELYEVGWDNDMPEYYPRAFAPAKESWR